MPLQIYFYFLLKLKIKNNHDTLPASKQETEELARVVDVGDSKKKAVHTITYNSL